MPVIETELSPRNIARVKLAVSYEADWKEAKLAGDHIAAEGFAKTAAAYWAFAGITDGAEWDIPVRKRTIADGPTGK